MDRNKFSRDPPSYTGVRGMVTHLSSKARAKLLFTTLATSVEFKSMMTLTYGVDYPRDGRRVKKHLNAFLTTARRRSGMQYIWFLEFQKRGAPHVHIMVDVVPSEDYRLVDFAKTWVGAVYGKEEKQRFYSDITSREVCDVMEKMTLVHAHGKSWERIRPSNGAAGYVSKYALKPWQKDVPREYQNVGRFWGCSQGVRDGIEQVYDQEINEDELREIMKTEGHKGSEWDIVPKYLFGMDCFT